MTPSLMSLSTLQQLSDLAPTTKAELAAWIRNRMTPVICCADMIAIGEASDVPQAARTVTREGRLFLEELGALLKRNPNGHLGTTKE